MDASTSAAAAGSPSLWTWHQALAVGIVNIAGGALFGVSIGFVPVYTTLVLLSQNCSAFDGGPAACLSVGGSGSQPSCQWISSQASNATNDASSYCAFLGGAAANCAWRHNRTECVLATGKRLGNVCEWVTTSGGAEYCRNRIGFSPLSSGLFSGALICGAMVGSLFMSVAGQRLRIDGSRAFIIVGTVASCGCAAVHASATFDDPVASTPFVLLLIGRAVLGVALAIACVACPMFVERHAPVSLRRPLGILFQVFSTVLVAGIAVVGIVIAPPHGAVAAVDFRFRFQLLCGIVSFVGLLMLLLGIFQSVTSDRNMAVEEATISPSERALLLGERPICSVDDANVSVLNEPASIDDPASHKAHPTIASCLSRTSSPRRLMCRLVAVGVVMSFAQQLTGINAVVNYAPNIAERMGFTPMLGNVVVMSWKTIVTLCSIPVSAICSLRRMFLVGTAVASIGCTLAALGINADLLPTEGTRTATAACGIGLFVVAFEVGMGGSFYVLSQQIFPIHLRPIGSSITLLSQFAFNILVNVVFPVAVAALSQHGGSDDRGMSIVFFFFAACGVASLACLIPCLHPFSR